MNEGTRFDLAYEMMPWDKVDVVVFDIGNVLIRFAPDDFIEKLFPGDKKKQQDMLDRVYNGKYWQLFDLGTMTYEEAAKRLVEDFGGEEKDYLHALYGWIELKTPIEEGWRAAKRCREMGKKLYLLSNYPQAGYERLRVKFADHFSDLFDGGFISCYEHKVKPDAAVYEILAERGRFDPARTVFIDDTLKNIEGAMKTGMHGFHMHETGMMDRFFL
ncbi:MAG: HAD-IA family hydrolase [Kiritimatiellae bacterium]|nr:HAD-IA family hydrolase [Kiritimatiellia bacterium]